METIIKLILIIAILFTGCRQDRYRADLPVIKSADIRIAPEYYSDEPGLPSPVLSEKGREMVLVKTTNDIYTWLDATVENGEPFDHKRNLYGKGNQLLADEEDFRVLAIKGIHSERELSDTKTITGRSVSRITIDGRPLGSSGVGFMADDETIMSVILADNQTAIKLGLTHADLCRPLFHFWNISREFENFNLDTVSNESYEVESLIYNGHRILFKITGSRGWQESIFNDEILGSGHIEIWRELDTPELDFLKKNYGSLPPEKLEKLKNMLSYIHTGEMVFFYINRYGFYEGHTEYRVDPVAVAFVFGLKSIQDVHRVCGGDLYTYFTTHFTTNPE